MATPEQNLSAWHTLRSKLEADLVATRENARARRTYAEDVAVLPSAQNAADWEATEYAAQQLLEAVKRLPAPKVAPAPHADQVSLDMAGDVHYIGETGGLHALLDVASAELTDDPAKVTCDICRRILADRPQSVDKPVGYPHRKGHW